MNTLEPKLYKLKVGEKNMHYLEPSDVCFEIHGSDYGIINDRVKLFHKAYSTTLGSMGILLTGNPGTGKTRLAEKLCNHAIGLGMPVVIVTDIKTSINTVNYISMLRNVVILFDEFGKNFNRTLQDKMLSMFSGVSSGKKFFILTENDTNVISPFILNRPGRVRYHIDYERLEEAILIGYCKDNNISEEIYSKIYKLYEKTTAFSFDHLQAIVTEVNFTPNDDFDTMIDRLNLSLLTPKVYVMVEKILDKDGEVVKLTCNDRPLQKDFLQFSRFYISGNVPIKNEPTVEPTEEVKPPGLFGNNNSLKTEYINITVTKDDITEISETGYICVSGEYKVYIKIV